MRVSLGSGTCGYSVPGHNASYAAAMFQNMVNDDRTRLGLTRPPPGRAGSV